VSTSPIATKTILSKTLKLQRNVMQFWEWCLIEPRII
jgi:hypothetical protein